MLERIFCGVLIVLFITGCRREGQKTLFGPGEKKVSGNYAVIENYEIAEGPHAGFKGSNSYTIRVGEESTRDVLVIENIANAYTVRGIRHRDSVFLPMQKFPSHRDSVSISGAGKFIGDSLFMELFSGGPAGRIKSECRAKKIY